MATATEIGRDLTAKSVIMAHEIEQKFLAKPSVGTAGRLIDIAAELGPQLFAPNNGSLEDALKEAKRHVDSAALPPNVRETGYEHFERVARIYGIALPPP